MNLKRYFPVVVISLVVVLVAGCSSPGKHRKALDQTAYTIIEQKQMEALGYTEPFSVEPPEDTLRRRLLIGQNLNYSSKASLGIKDLDEIDHWPNDDYLEKKVLIQDATATVTNAPVKLTLIDALKIAAKNNRQYQTSKENVFRAALSLDLQRDRFRNTFAGSMDNTLSTNLGGNETVSGNENTGLASVSRQFLNGVSLTGRIGIDLVKLLNPYSESSAGLFGDVSIAIPLMRGSGKHIVAEPLLQSERDALYAIYDFEQFKREFAVNITNIYLSTLQSLDQIKNADADYRRRITSSRFLRRQADAGRVEVSAVDEALEEDFSARNSWVGTLFNYQSSLDSLKMQLGLPPDAQIELERDELDRLTQSARNIIRDVSSSQQEEIIPPADALIVLEPINRENAGPMELDEKQAIELAFENRLDLRIALGSVYDAQRKVVVAADGLRAEFTLLGSAAVGEGRSLGSASQRDNFDLDFEKGRYNALLSLDLPIERTSEIVSYRLNILNLERAVRDYQNLEDLIKLDIRQKLRDLHRARESLQIAAQQVALSESRVRNQDLLMEAGRAVIRELLIAQSSLLSSQNSLTNAMKNYRMGELELQRDLDVLEIDPNGLWIEFSPTEEKND